MGSNASRPASSNSARTALEALRRIVQALRLSAAQAQRETGLSGAQLFVLGLLVPQPLSINALAERTHTHQSSVSAVVQRLEAAGLVERRTRSDDRRKVEASLTLRGRRLAARSPGVAQDALFAALRALPEGLRDQLAIGLVRLADGMGLESSAPMFFEEPLGPRAGQGPRSESLRNEETGSRSRPRAIPKKQRPRNQ